MSWDFETDPEFQSLLDWVGEFVREEVEPIDYLIESPYDHDDPLRQALIPPLQQKVRKKGLWATYLGPELGGKGYGQVTLAPLNEILGRASTAPIVFGSEALDSGNREILARFGTPMLKERYLKPLNNEIGSCFSMTEPQGGADPKIFDHVRDGDEWVINGKKWFSSYAQFAALLIVMTVTHTDNPPYKQQTMLIAPVTARALQLHGSLGVTHEMPFVRHLVESFVMGLADGPTEFRKAALARELLRTVTLAPGLFPAEHVPAKRAAAQAKYVEVLARFSVPA